MGTGPGSRSGRASDGVPGSAGASPGEWKAGRSAATRALRRGSVGTRFDRGSTPQWRSARQVPVEEGVDPRDIAPLVGVEGADVLDARQEDRLARRAEGRDQRVGM